MIKANIKIKYICHFNAIQNFNNHIYVSDYSEQTKTQVVKRAVELNSPLQPVDIDSFSIINTPNLNIDGIVFDNTSFIYPNGSAKSQCEAVFFPTTSSNDSWVLFCELKYSSKPLNNRNNLRKAIKQLIKTHYYYYQDSIVSKSNQSYLIASLPLQSEPFNNFSVSPVLLVKLKRTKNVVLRLKNSVIIKDDKLILV